MGSPRKCYGSSLGGRRLSGCNQGRLPVGGDLEEGVGFAYAQRHRKAFLSEETTHAKVGRPEDAACVQEAELDARY